MRFEVVMAVAVCLYTTAWHVIEKSVILNSIFWVKIQHDDLYAESMGRRNMLPDLYPIHYAAVSCQTKKLHGGWS
jgi:hypothetical protein